jgi:hypothetical protein
MAGRRGTTHRFLSSTGPKRAFREAVTPVLRSD